MGAHSTVFVRRSDARLIYKTLVLVNYGPMHTPHPSNTILELFFDRVLDKVLQNTLVVPDRFDQLTYSASLLESYTKEYLAEHPEEIRAPGSHINSNEQEHFIAMLKRAGIRHRIAVQDEPALASTTEVATVVQVGRNPFSCMAFQFDSTGKLLRLN